MEHNPQSGRAVARTVVVDLVAAAVIFALGALVVYDSYRLGSSWGADGPQSGYFPFYIGVLTCLSSGVVFVQSLLKLKSDQHVFVESGQLKQVLLILVPSTVYVLGVQFIGIYVSSAIFIGLFMRLLGKYSWLRSAAVGVGVSAISFLLFEIWFSIPLPKGPVESLFGY
ncbi:MAG TPA: tripartite tricarboxylate transporter TctB family protein [Burkholderiales bacterium]|nr:tripartite tricarboxylate transporter TctB family protein [Burkholderiales bacterium]